MSALTHEWAQKSLSRFVAAIFALVFRMLVRFISTLVSREFRRRNFYTKKCWASETIKTSNQVTHRTESRPSQFSRFINDNLTLQYFLHTINILIQFITDRITARDRSVCSRIPLFISFFFQLFTRCSPFSMLHSFFTPLSVVNYCSKIKQKCCLKSHLTQNYESIRHEIIARAFGKAKEKDFGGLKSATIYQRVISVFI